MKKFGHTSGKKLPQYVRYRAGSRRTRDDILPPPVKVRYIKPSCLRPFSQRHPIMRLILHWEGKTTCQNRW